MSHPTLTAERLHELLDYDPETGVFTWRVRRKYAQPGDVANYHMSAGYIQIAIDCRHYLAHRLAWFFVHGIWPRGQIDHINGVKDDNRISNLRDVTPSGNGQNIDAPLSRNKAGLRGVSPNGPGWTARICVDHVVTRLGTYRTPEEARAAYLSAKRRLHPFWNDMNHG